MNSNRKTARIVGVLFITATVTAILSYVSGGILDAPDYLIYASENENSMLIGLLLELICAGACVGIAIVLFPILRKHNEALALGYVGARMFEGVLFFVSSLSYLLLLTLSQEYVAGAPDASHFQALGTLLIAVHDRAFWLGGGVIAFCLGALILNYLLYQSRLIPRFLSVWGLIGATLMLSARLLQIFGLIGSNLGGFEFLPIGVNEMVLAVWLIAKGFNSSAIASASAKTDINEIK